MKEKKKKQICIYLSDELLRQIEKFNRKNPELSKSAAIALLIRQGLEEFKLKEDKK